jgi:hypothetical protein
VPGTGRKAVPRPSEEEILAIEARLLVSLRFTRQPSGALQSPPRVAKSRVARLWGHRPPRPGIARAMAAAALPKPKPSARLGIGRMVLLVALCAFDKALNEYAGVRRLVTVDPPGKLRAARKAGAASARPRAFHDRRLGRLLVKHRSEIVPEHLDTVDLFGSERVLPAVGSKAARQPSRAPIGCP